MPTIVTDHGQLVTQFRAATVELKDNYSDAEWLPASFVYCDRLTLAVNAYDEAELSRELGEIANFGTDFYAPYSPLSLIGKFVRITVHPDESTDDEDLVWIGYIVGTAKQRSAVKGDGMAQALTGKKQVVRAVGLEYFLDRVQIDASIVFDTTRILRSMPFNGGRGVSLDPDTRTRANRCDEANADGVLVFAGPGQPGELWTLTNIIAYLLYYFTPRNNAGDPSPDIFTLSADDIIAGVCDGIAPTLDPEGMTVYQVLNKLLSPQRGLVWWLDGTQVRVESLATEVISLPSGGTLPANRDQQTLDFDKQRDVDDVALAEAGSRIYHQVIVRGARMTSTATLGNISTEELYYELTKDWSQESEQEYYDAAAATDGYDALSEAQKKKRNDAFRKAERLYRVFGAFRLYTGSENPAEVWDGKSGDGSDAERNWTFPVLSENGSIVDTLEYSIEGLRFLNLTRLKRGWSYEDTANIEETQPTGSEAEYMPTFAILQVAAETEIEDPEDPAYPGTFPAKYQFVEKMSEHDFGNGGELVSPTINVSYDLHMQQTVPGVLLIAQGMQHAASLNVWDEGAEPTGTEPQVDYDTLRVTTTIEADTYCEAKYPADVDLPADVAIQKLTLYVGDQYRLDFLAENTVVDLENGEPVLTNGGVLRDDRERLQDIARVAYEWYQQDRLPLTVNFRHVRNLFRLGMMITTIGSSATQETVNSVVSMIAYDLTNGTTQIKTNDENLDLIG